MRHPRAIRPPPGFQAGPGLAIWVIGLLSAAGIAACVGAIALWQANTPDAATTALRAWGVLGPDQRWEALHADAPDARSGCLLTEDALIRWEDQQVTGRIALGQQPVSVAIEPAGLRVGAILCPSDPGSDLRAFRALVARRAQVREEWHPGPDPRVAHLWREARR